MENGYFRVKILNKNKEDMGYLLVAHDDYCFTKGLYRGSLFTTKTFNSEYIQEIIQEIVNNFNLEYVIEDYTEKRITKSLIFKC